MKKIFNSMIVIMLIAIAFFNLNIFAEDNSISSIYYYNEKDIMERMDYNFSEDFTEIDKIEFIFNQMMREPNINYIPEGTELLSVTKESEEIILDFSKEINNHGGNYYERNLVNQFVKTGISFPNCKYVTILVEGKLVPLNEGLEVYRLRKLIV